MERIHQPAGKHGYIFHELAEDEKDTRYIRSHRDAEEQQVQCEASNFIRTLGYIPTQ